MIIDAYAKLNLILNVKGKRPDGYHEIETVFQAIDLCDRVRVEASEDGRDGLVFLPSGRYMPDIPLENNLAFIALERAKKAFGKEAEYFSVSVEKNIPLAGGLGGGSADAAAVLTALSRLWDLPWEEMLPTAALLGSDVPFCLVSQNGHPAAVGRGRGEILEYIEPVKGRISLYSDEIHMKSKTARVYNALIPEDYLVQYDIGAFIKAESLEEKIKYMGNHLQPALERLTRVKRDMILCGAGPTYFRFDRTGEFESIV